MAAVAELRLRHATTQPERDDAEPSVTMTRGQLRALVQDAVTAALAAAAPAPATPGKLLSVSEMAARLGVHRSKVNAMRLEGCPAVRLGSIYRFDPAEVMVWLRTRGEAS
jgi:excisionase family DNA binding protein